MINRQKEMLYVARIIETPMSAFLFHDEAIHRLVAIAA